MDSFFLQNIQKQVAQWRADGYAGVHKETENILSHIRRVAFLHEPQIEALETYIFLKEVIGNKPSVEVFRQSFQNELELIRALGISDKEAFELAYDKKKNEKIQAILDEKFGTSDYANQVYALTMGSGKTILMAVMMLYDCVLSFYHKDDERFAKNALGVAPDTTIIESLKEIKTFDYSRVLPKEYENIILNIKYHYLESTDTPLAPNGNYNVIVSNSQKIILKTRNGDENNATKRLFGDKNELGKREVENMRLQAIRQLGSLQIFVDEAHHSYGKTLEGTLKKTRQTIDYLHKHTPLISVVNLTGTPYVNNKMISDVVYHFGLKQGIEKGTEGWNCRSLVSVALYKKPKSTILVLQSTTRCLRAIGDNSTRAHIFLSKENYKILDKELKNNFASSISELNTQDQKMVEHTLEVEKRKTIKVKKVLKEILAVQEANAENIKVDFKKFKPERYQSFVSEGGIFLGDEGNAGYSEVRAVRKIEDKNDFTFYEIVEIINRYTHLSCIVISSIISSSKKRDEFVKMTNENFALVPFIVQEILKSAYKYEEKTEIVEEELELTKLFPFKISVQQGRNTLVVYKETEAEEGRKGRIGFHINPYAFDSSDEKDLFRYLRSVLEKKETIKDIYFTGARVCADPSRTDFYFEYWSPEQKRMW